MLDVMSQIALVRQTVSTADTAIPPIVSHHNAQTVSRDGWDQLVTTGAFMDIQRKVSASAIPATPIKDVTVSVQVMESASKDFTANAIRFQEMLIQDQIVSFQDVLAGMETVMAEAFVISIYNVANAMLVGQETLVMNQTAQGLPGVLVMESVVKPCLGDAIATKIGPARAVKYLASTALIMGMNLDVFVGLAMLV